ncbi:MAG TPA: zf-TFIIB domain-containing protein [Acidimicrobiales bacterium]|nr:zf-TFIIB domain-containing protein [Acidimicrobiales bacterium]
MSTPTATCPTCSGPLTLTASGQLDTWVCPAGHGAGMTVTEAHGRLQEDEISQLWQKARAAGPGPRACPSCGRPMGQFDVSYDPDEVPEGQPGDTADTGAAPLDVCAECQFLWFDAGELEQFPDDLPDPEPTPAQQEALERIRRAFGEGIVAAAHEREGHQLTERVYRLLTGTRYARVVDPLTRD